MKINPIIDAPTTSTSLNKQQVNLSPFKTNDLKFNKSNYLDIFSYHDKIAELLSSNTNKETSEQKQQRNIKNKNINNLDRRSFYDNNQNNNNNKSNDIELLLVEQDAIISSTTSTTTSDELNSIEDTNINTSKPVERDDFDDLVSMTHRIPKKKVIIIILV